MTERSARFALPFILPGQAQKEHFHNEALAALDGLVHSAVEGMAADAPPTPQDGECWLVEEGATGLFEGHDHALACFTVGGWRFLAPRAGMGVYDLSAGLTRRWTGSGWGGGTLSGSELEIGGVRVVGMREGAIAGPVGGSVIDSQARAAIEALIVTLKSHGLTD